MRVTKSHSVDKEWLVHVVFERDGPEANTPHIEVVYEIHFPETYTLTDPLPCVLSIRSVTRTDTRESVDLTRDERRLADLKASEFAATLTKIE